MIQHREIRESNLKIQMTTTNILTSSIHYLNVEVFHSKHHVLAAISELLAGHAYKKLSMIQDDDGDGSQMNIEKWNISQLGTGKSHSGFVNSDEMKKILKSSQQVV